MRRQSNCARLRWRVPGAGWSAPMAVLRLSETLRPGQTTALSRSGQSVAVGGVVLQFVQSASTREPEPS